MNKSRLYRITFYNQGTLYELYAKQVLHGELLGFIEIKDIVFGNSTLVVDPVEERLKTEFAGVKSTFIPMQAVLRIDEVEKKGATKIRELPEQSQGNIAHFPPALFSNTNFNPTKDKV